jgi:5-formyltetrahydrofolate cyclo-ligase
MFPSISDQKSQLRRECKSIRKELGNEVRQQASRAICAHLAAWDIFQKSETILTYMPMRTEVDLLSLLASFPEKRWLLPRIIPEEDYRMVFHPYDPQQLIEHPFGMAEPAPHLPQVAPAEIQLALVPGLAFDRCGWRLGYGGGYFDRFLKDFGGVSVGVVFQALRLDFLPHNEHDIPMQWLVTDGGLVKTGESHHRPVSQESAARG